MDVLKELKKLRRSHHHCEEDCWYSCPKSERGCCKDDESDECNCGADRHNAILDNIINYLKSNQATEADL